MKKLVTLFFILLAGSSIAQKHKSSYNIDVTIKGIKDTTCYLGNYFFTETTGKFFVQDTAKVDSNGHMVFKKDTTLMGGLYIITVPNKGYFEFILSDEQHFSIATDTSDFVGNMKVVGSKETALFNEFRQEMSKRYRVMIEADKARKGKDDKATDAKIKGYQAELALFQEKFFKDNEGTLVVKLVKAAQDPVLPEAYRSPKNRQDTINTYNYYKDHFLDNIDLSDERLMRTPYLGSRLMSYMNFGGAESDTLIKYADNIMARTAKASKAMRKAIIFYLTNQYESGGDEKKMRIMGTEGVFVHLGKKYYIGEPTLWDSSTISRFKERLATLEPVLLGKQVKNMYPTDSLGNYITPLYDVKSKYTVLFIFDPNCGHCKEKAPKLVEWANTSKHKDLAKVYATCGLRGDQAMKDWKKFMKEHLKGFPPNRFYNGFDSKSHIDFRNWFDVVVYPVMYLLDKDKKVVGRGIGVGDLDGVIDMRERVEKFENEAKAKKLASSQGKK